LETATLGEEEDTDADVLKNGALRLANQSSTDNEESGVNTEISRFVRQW